ncbi:hypothetical protein KAR48_18295 [bacterium]|nr:hypothetical protein [bacterium]
MDRIITKNIKKAGKPGTIKFVRIYGDDFICTRYKYDYKKKKHYKTIEICVDEKDWTPSENDRHSHKRVYIHIEKQETDLIRKIEKADGILNRFNGLWKVPIQVVWDLDLEDRIVIEPK